MYKRQVIYKTGTWQGETYIKKDNENIESTVSRRVELTYPNVDSIILKGDKNRVLYIYKYDNVIVITRPYVDEHKEDNMIHRFYITDRVNIIDINNSEHIIQDNSSVKREFENDFQILAVDDKNIYCTYSDLYENKQLDFRDNVQINVIDIEKLEITDLSLIHI